LHFSSTCNRSKKAEYNDTMRHYKIKEVYKLEPSN
jgi:hypothetical protein